MTYNSIHQDFLINNYNSLHLGVFTFLSVNTESHPVSTFVMFMGKAILVLGLLSLCLYLMDDNKMIMKQMVPNVAPD